MTQRGDHLISSAQPPLTRLLHPNSRISTDSPRRSSDNEHCSLTSSMLRSIEERNDLPRHCSSKKTVILSIGTAKKRLVQSNGQNFPKFAGRRSICACVSLITGVHALGSPQFNAEAGHGQVRCNVHGPSDTTSKSGNRWDDRDYHAGFTVQVNTEDQHVMDRQV